MRLSTIALVALAVLPGTVGSQAAGDQGELRPAARVRVSITEFKFTPKNIQVHVGDTVQWINNGTMVHTSTANGGLWDSGNLAPGARFSFKFTAPGNFPYHCTIHPTLMQGIVKVIP